MPTTGCRDGGVHCCAWCVCVVRAHGGWRAISSRQIKESISILNFFLLNGCLRKYCKFHSAAANSQTFAAKRGRRRRPTKELSTLQFSYGHVVLPPFSPVRMLPFQRKLRVCTIIHHFLIHATCAHNCHRGTIKYDRREQTHGRHRRRQRHRHMKFIPSSTPTILFPKRAHRQYFI